MNSGVEQERAIELYGGTPLERVGAAGLVLNEHLGEEGYYLASDIVVGNCGVIGFALAEHKPKPRWTSYTDGNAVGRTFDGEFLLGMQPELADDPIRRAHFLGTENGFRIIRYFVLPAQLKEVFDRNKILGKPFIDNCCLPTLPENFDEESGDIDYIFGVFDSDKPALIPSIVRYADPTLEENDQYALWRDLGHHAYVSFHASQVYKPIVEKVQQSLFQAVRNFDTLLSSFPGADTVPLRGLDEQSAVIDIPMLPPSQ